MSVAIKRSRLVNLLLISILSLGLVVTCGYSEVAKADDLPVEHVSGTLTENTTWTNDIVYVVDDDLAVPDGITLTVNAGTIVKYATWNGNGGISVATGGTLDVNGTSGSPVIFTSLNDDSYGGDSAADGSTSGANGDYPSAVASSEGTVDIARAVMKYSTYSVYGNCSGSSGTVTVVDSQVANAGCAGLSLQRNSFSVPAGTNPIYINGADMSGIILTGINKNTFIGSGTSKAIRVSNAELGSGKAWTLDASSGAHLVVDGLTVSGNLAVGAGFVIKTQGLYTTGLTVDGTGVLDVMGSVGSPAIFTSIQDDTVAGDSGNDGATTGSVSDYATAIYAGGNSMLLMEHATVRYGSQGVVLSCGASSADTINDSTFYSSVSTVNCVQSTLTMQRNQFSVASATNQHALTLNNTNPTGVVLSGSNKNVVSGSGKAGAVAIYESTIPSSQSWTLASNAAPVVVLTSLTVDGTLNVSAGTVRLNTLIIGLTGVSSSRRMAF